jgi:heme-degrading monooxygenase HmoA
VVDIWESRQDFDQFVESRLDDAMGQALGDRAESPQITEFELHTIYTR